MYVYLARCERRVFRRSVGTPLKSRSGLINGVKSGVMSPLRKKYIIYMRCSGEECDDIKNVYSFSPLCVSVEGRGVGGGGLGVGGFKAVNNRLNNAIVI